MYTSGKSYPQFDLLTRCRDSTNQKHQHQHKTKTKCVALISILACTRYKSSLPFSMLSGVFIFSFSWLYTTALLMRFLARKSEDIASALVSMHESDDYMKRRSCSFTRAGPLTLDWPARFSSTRKTPCWNACTKATTTTKNQNQGERTGETVRHSIPLGEDT